jgi:DNA topoisomerase-1
MRLRRVSPNSVGWSRRRAGRGWIFLDADGNRLPAADADRCRLLVIPPAWRDVWICPIPHGHIQAVGIDDAGRRQYIYHEQWRIQRDAAKYDRLLVVARRLPQAREQVLEHLALAGMPRERALAAAFRMLDLGYFRVGGEAYADANGSYGLATLLKSHVRMSRGGLVFEFVAKSGLENRILLTDEPLLGAITLMRRRRGGTDELLAFREGSRWRDVTTTDINEYVKEVIREEVSAKDFRTWHGTVLAAIALATSPHSPNTRTGRRRAVAQAMREVAEDLGNTPAVARKAYVDPRLIDLYEDGHTIEPALRRLGKAADLGTPEAHEVAERAVARLLAKAPKSRDQSRLQERA